MERPGKCCSCIGRVICYLGHVFDSPLCKSFQDALEEKFNSAAQSGPTNKQSTPCDHIFRSSEGSVKCILCGAVYDLKC